jgi:dTDP-glucose pyrophosphorylase
MAPKTRVHDWAAITLREADSFSAALKLMNQGGYQLALVRREDGRLAGMVTDSDIRKALLRGIGLEQPVAEVMNASPLVVSAELGEAEAHQLMLLNHFFHLPVVDAEGQLVGLHVAEQLRSPEPRDEALVIMAGGRGQRLMPLTANTPKPMLPLRGRPILEHIIEQAKLDGFHRIVISVNYLAELIIDYFGNGSNHGVAIEYLQEDQPLGTAGALAHLPADAKANAVVVTNADIKTDAAYSDLLSQTIRESADGLMAVRRQEWQNPFGVVRSQGKQLIGMDEKPIYRHQVNAGMYVLTPRLLELLEPNKYCDMPDLFSRGLERRLNLQIFPIHEPWLDIGRPSDYQAAGGFLPQESR